MKHTSPVQPAQGLINTEVQWVNECMSVCVCVCVCTGGGTASLYGAQWIHMLQLPAGLRTLNNYLYEELQRMLQSRNLNRRKQDFTVQIDLLAALNGQ